MAESPPANLAALADLETPWSIRVAVTLRLADHIADGVGDVGRLADVVGCDRERLWGLLAHLAARGVFREVGPGRYGMNEAARQLLDPNLRRFLDLSGIGGRFAGVYSTLADFVRTGQTHYAALFGVPFWEDLAAHPGLSETFDRLMAEGHGEESRVPPLIGGWDRVRWVIDVGGGKGHVVSHLLCAHEGLRATVVDLPATAARAAKNLSALGFADRAEAVGQSFFDPLPAGADVYLLVGVLNDWPDDQATQILRRCAEALPPDGRVLVQGGFRADGSVPGNQIDKLVAGGRDRPETEFLEMARLAGLAVLSMGSGVAECARGDQE